MIACKYILASALAICLWSANCQGALVGGHDEGSNPFAVPGDFFTYALPGGGSSAAFVASSESRSSQNNSQVLFPGDANLDLTVDFSDLGIVLNGYLQPGTWTCGDFDGSSVVDFPDLGLLLNNYNLTYDSTFGSPAVPEPSSVFVWLAVCSVVVVWHVRRRAPLSNRKPSAAFVTD